MFNYTFFNLSKVFITELESMLALAGVSSIRFNRMGSSVTSVVLRTTAGRATTAGVLLTEDEMAQVEGFGLPAKIKDKLTVIHSVDDLIGFIEREHDISLSQEVPAVPEPVVPEVTAHPAPLEPEVSSPLHEEVEPASARVSYEEKELISSGYVASPLPEEDLEGLEKLTYDMVFEERNKLIEEVKELKVKYRKLELEGGSPEKVEELEKELSNLKKQYSVSQELVSKFRDSNGVLTNQLDSLKNEFNDLQQTVSVQRSKIIELEARQASGAFQVELPRVDVPRMVQFMVSASSLSLAVSYRYILSNFPNAVIIDLCRESLMDTLVHLQSRVRLTKWLLEGMDVRAVYAPYEQMELQVSSGLAIVSSPNTVLSDDLFTQVDWAKKLKELSRLDRPVVVFLGIEDANGVSEFIDRLNAPVKVLRADNNFDSRAFSRIKYKHEESVEEVIV